MHCDAVAKRCDTLTRQSGMHKFCLHELKLSAIAIGCFLTTAMYVKRFHFACF